MSHKKKISNSNTIVNKQILTSILIIVTALTGTIFITHTNDHKECQTRTELSLGNEGETIISETHVCRELFHL